MSADADLPYSSDTEHDRQVRARLAELAAERNVPIEELLAELNARLEAGQILVPDN
ncbi:hypothetical protein [Streptomyces sp. NPDC002599]|uniref:hypothetical protein n=1 Tax=Streptomyces sp. NPDC002599 TaxID=3154421 RepID=UPI0033223D96